jgi:amino acid transporter
MSSARKFGWFAGVFTPSILTILGVIMYLRLPAIVGQAGLWTTLGIIALAHVISITTGLSVASVATDKKVEGGGTYYMISRSLGLSIGGTLGIALFVGLSFAVSLYIVGFSESFLGVLGLEQSVPNIQVTGTIVLIGVTTLTFISTSLALRTQFFVLTAIALSLLSIFAGVGRHELAPVAPAMATLTEAAPFIALFAIFFPAVTGFEAGVSMSGDLRDPKRAIPLGAISAILVGLLVYVLVAVFLATTVGPADLATNPAVLTDIALIGPLVLAGVWGATLSSALGSILGAPRILQATSADRVTPRFFALGSGRSREPRRALVVTFFIAWSGILLGELDTIARVVSMFFIATYGFLNLSCAIENWASPDFRPALRVPRWVSVLGAAACLVVMIQLDVVAMVGATLVLGLLYLYLTRKQLRLESGDAWHGFWSAVARATLHRLDRNPPHRRNWLPNVLLFAGPEGGRTHLMDFGRELAGKRGLVTNFHLVVRPEMGDAAAGIEPADLDGDEPPYGVFTRRVECPDPYRGMADVARYYGYAGIEPNTVLMGWPRRVEQHEKAGEMIRRFVDLDYNLLLLDYDHDRELGARRRVDFWVPRGTEQLGLMLALEGYLSAADTWREATFRFLVVGDDQSGQADARRLAARLGAERLPGEVRVVGTSRGRNGLGALLAMESRDADLTVVGLADVGGLQSRPGVAAATAAIDGVGSVLLVHASRDMRERPTAIVGRAVTPASVPAGDPMEVGVGAAADMGALEPLEPLADPVLDGAVAWLDGELQECARTLASGPLGEAYHEAARLSEAAARSIRQAMEAVDGVDPTGDSPRVSRSVRKVRGDLHFRSRRLLGDHAADGVTAQGQAMTALADGLLREVDRVSDAAERRLQSGEGRRVPWRALVRRHLSIRAPRVGLSVVDGFAAVADSAVTEARHHLGEAVAGLDGLEDALDRGDAAGARTARGGIAAATEAARVAAEARRGAARRAEANLHGALRDIARRVAADVGRVARGEPASAARGRRRTGQALGDRLRTEVSMWTENQRLLARTAGVDLELLAFQHRAETVVRRELAEIRLSVQNGVVARLDAVDDALAAGTDGDPRLIDGWQSPAIDTFLDGLVEKLRPATGELPETAEILAAGSTTARGVGGHAVEGLEVALRSLVELRLETDFVGPLHGDLSDAAGVFHRAEDTARDALRLAAVRLEDPEAGSGEAAQRSEMLDSARTRVRAARDAVQGIDARLGEAVPRRLEAAFGTLNPHALARTATRVPAYVRVLRGHDAVSWAGRQRERARRTAGELMGRLLYQRSATLIAARGLEQRAARSPDAALPRLVAAVRPDPAVLDALPYHYRQLFLGKPSYTRDFWVGWEQEMAMAATAVSNHRRGLGGGVAIIAEPYGGKTALARYVAEEHFGRDRIFVVTPPADRSTDPMVFHQRLRTALGAAAGTHDDPLSALRDAVIVLDDIELWWERSDEGYGVIRAIIHLIRRHGERILFLVAADAHAFRFMASVERLGPEFLSVIEATPFSARQIGEVIELRHSSTGLVFEYDGRREEDLSAWRRARLFNRIFDYSRGGIGAALHAWIAHIRRVDGDRIVVEAPRRPDLHAFEALHPTRLLILVQLILHRSLDRARLARLCPLDPATLDSEVSALLRAGVLHRPRPGLVAIDPFLRPHLTAWCTDRGLVP